MSGKNIYSYLLAFIFLLTNNTYAGDFYIADIKTVNTDDNLTVSAVLDGEFDKNVIETIQSGITATLKYYIELKASRGLWLDKKISSKTIFKNVKYNILTKEYHLTSIDGDHNSNEVTKDFDVLMNWMTQLRDVVIASSDRLSRNKEYYIRLKAEMATKKLWFPLNYILFFIPMKDINTGWIISNFTYTR